MRPLPRVHAVTDARVLALPDFGVRAAAIAAAGPAAAIHARDRAASGAALAAAALRLVALARPPEAAVFVNGRPDIAAAVGGQGVQLGREDIAVADARCVAPHRWIGRSVHTVPEAESAIAEGADFLLAGNVYRTASHPDRPAAGLGLVERIAALGVPVIAIGGVGPDQVRDVKAAGAYGVAAVSALWDAPDPAAAALALLEPWMDDV